MIRYTSERQLSLEGFILTFVGKLSPKNCWVLLSRRIPWEEPAFAPSLFVVEIRRRIGSEVFDAFETAKLAEIEKSRKKKADANEKPTPPVVNSGSRADDQQNIDNSPCCSTTEAASIEPGNSPITQSVFQVSLFKLLCLGIQNTSKKWTMPIKNWSVIISQLAIFFEGMLDKELKL